ncbi:nephronectin isoform X2 [Oryzias latipes]|uniref:nephronectin isoform X2 n=1 Tax=Oryzias latipes TaxID=8090 RepID=UPI000CE28B85|nr:nephronectin isoform X2 [Oryzias latipes]
MLALVLLALTQTLTRSQRLDYNSWLDQAAPSDGLCRYGNSVECCWGWKQADGGRCQPHCQHACKHGDCVVPDRCKCHPGFSGKACNQDLNECGLRPRPCKHRCMNTPGSFKCYCLDGYELQPDGSCRIRTCYHANCQYGCEVIKGQVRCTCPSPGLRLGPDRRTCVDVDECVSGGGVCPRRRKCVNTFGSFICKCHLGFRLTYVNGRYTCLDKDPRPFCSLNPSSPKCRCKDGCTVVPKVTVYPPKPRTPPPLTTTATTAAPVTAAPPTAATTVPTIATTVTSVTTAMETTRPPLTDASTTTASTTTTLPTTTEMDTTTLTTTSTTTTTTATTTTATTTTATTSTATTSTATTTTASTSTATTTTATTSTATTTTASTSTATTTTATTSPATTTTATTASTMSAVITVPTVALTTTMLPTSSLKTTTISNRINKDVTQRQRGDVHIPRLPGNNEDWDFDIELGNTAEDARDDPEAGRLHCTFHRGLCSWMSDRDGDLPWEAERSPAGQYLSVPELKAGQRSIRGARLALQVPPSWSHGDLCFSFSHWLTGHHVGVLQLFIKKKGRDERYGPALWSRTGGHGWRRTQVTLTMRSVDRVLMKAERRKGRRGQMAIDDVTLSQGACR